MRELGETTEYSELIIGAIYYFRLRSWPAGRAKEKKEAEAANKQREKN